MKTKFTKIAVLVVLLATAGGMISCGDDDNVTPQEKSLYQKLGGFEKVPDPNNPGQMIEKGRLSYRSVVDSTIMLIVSDIGTGASGNLGMHFAPIVAEVGSGNTTKVAVLSKI
ncbi:hypothetical protein QW060_24970 [Myroides ceti]|uniref:Uncharacterized protein n=1 Tax=Paenimyroides ceti TaxID=395087 RepID=A0ABT8CZW8_9FLAO|nr:hypothetical protein [Paenimyroides ceti]MDN3710133.1 hypothetical protein [Paenimyroides ceti]